LANTLTKLSATLLFVFSISACSLESEKNNTDIALPVKYKDIVLSFLKANIDEVTFSPIANGNLFLKNKLYGGLTLSSSSFETLATLAKTLSLPYVKKANLPSLILLNNTLPEKRKTIDQVFQIGGSDSVTTYQLKTLNAFILEKNNKTFEIWIINPDDNDIYYVLNGVTTVENAKVILDKIHRAY